MKKLLTLFILIFVLVSLTACGTSTDTTAESPTTTTTVDLIAAQRAVYQLLIDAEELSGMSNYNGVLITVSGNLGLPTEYRGVTITYSSRNKDLISDTGIVTLPDACWVESRDQQGTDNDDFKNLNDNWPIVVDVTMTCEGQTRTAKLMFTIAPAEGFTCDKYQGNE